SAGAGAVLSTAVGTVRSAGVPRRPSGVGHRAAGPCPLGPGSGRPAAMQSLHGVARNGSLPGRPGRRECGGLLRQADSIRVPGVLGRLAPRPLVPLLPGLGTAAAGVAAAMAVHALLPAAGALIVALLLGAVLANTGLLPQAARPGLKAATRTPMRAGLGLRSEERARRE